MWVALLPSLSNNLLSFQPPLTFPLKPFQSVSAHFPISKSMPHILGFCNGSTCICSCYYCCIANYHKIKYPKQLFHLLKIWRLENSGWSQLGNLCLMHLLSAGVTGAGCPPEAASYVSLIRPASQCSLVSLLLHMVSHPLLPIRIASASHNMVPSGQLCFFTKAGLR